MAIFCGSIFLTPPVGHGSEVDAAHFAPKLLNGKPAEKEKLSPFDTAALSQRLFSI